MEKELKDRWVVALRNGGYGQGRDALRSLGGVEGFCCLGVLCDLVEPEGWEQVMADGGYAYGHPLQNKVMYKDELLSKQACLELGLSYETQLALAGLNDDGATFAQIADVIEGIDISAPHAKSEFEEILHEKA